MTTKEKVLSGAVILLSGYIICDIVHKIQKRNKPDIFSFTSDDNKVGYIYKGETKIDTIKPDTKIKLGDYTIEPTLTDNAVTGITLSKNGVISENFGKGAFSLKKDL